MSEIKNTVGQNLYKWGTLGVATTVAIAVSLACSYWFFYSLMGSNGPQAIGAGIAGCTLQIFGYGFAASFLKVNPIVRFLLCAMPLALSMFSSYSAIYGFLSHEQETKHSQSMKTEIVYDLLEQSATDKRTASEAASNGINGKYKSMGKDLLDSNERAMQRDIALLDKIGEPLVGAEASPLDGLVKVTGDAAQTTILFCAWLAILFDLLPVVAISVLSKTFKSSKSIKSLDVDIEITETVHLKTQENKVEQTVVTDAEEKSAVQSVGSTILEKTDNEPLPHEMKMISKEKKTTVRDGDDSYNDVVLKLRKGAFEPNYTAYQEYTGRSKWQAQSFFKQAQENGHIRKSGRAFEVVSPLTNVAKLPSSAQAAQ